MTISTSIKKYFWVWALLVVAFVAIYYPIVPRMVNDWDADPNSSHGFLIPFVSLWFAYKAWPDIKDIPLENSTLGVPLVLFGLLSLSFGITVHELFTTRVSLVILLAGVALTFLGPKIFHKLLLPIGFLAFMVPIPVTLYDAIALPLRGLVSILATEGMQACGLPVLREGNVIILPNVSLEVVEACSGMRSLVSLIALGTAYAFLMLHGAWRRTALIIATIPIAVLTNVARVFITGVLARHYGSAAAEGFFHDFAGFVVFFVALILTGCTGWVLSNIPFKRKEDKHAQ